MNVRLVLSGALAVGLMAPIGIAPPASAAESTKRHKNVVAYVDPLIGSANGGNTYPGAVRPFGMLSWSPTTTKGDQTDTGAANGYQYDTTRTRGFALTHVNGAGCHPGASGDVPIFPHVGAVTSSPTADTKDATFASDFTHTDEVAQPGRYSLDLANGAETDFAATTRAGIGTFSFPQGKQANLLFRTSNSLNGSEDAKTRINRATRTVTGSVLTGGFCGRRGNGGGSNKFSYYRLYFTAHFDQPFVRTGTWVDDSLRPGTRSASGGEGYEKGDLRAGRGSGGWVGFDPKQKVTMRIGISYTSQKAAEANLRAELAPRATVKKIATAGTKIWNDQLRRVEVAGGS
ncbi:MAG: glycoside hydrolase family 92 protein, partial [Aeromicrobium sp.]